MKKTLLISAGILIILVVLGIWAYLFTFGTPKSSSEIFTNFGIQKNTETTITPDPVTVDVRDTTPAGSKQSLKQLTTRPVAGAVFTSTGIQYVEQGTGHIYSINLETGTEHIVSGTTILNTREAHFSKDGQYVTVTTLTGDVRKTVAGKVPTTEGGSTFSGISLPSQATNVSFGTASNTLVYTLSEKTTSRGYSYNLVSEKTTQLFTIPLRDVRIIWGKAIYAFTTPTIYQNGFIYHIKGDSLEYVTKGMYGLSALPYQEGLVLSGKRDEKLSSFALNEGIAYELSQYLLPEKCTLRPGIESALYCGALMDTPIGELPDGWYKGSLWFSDSLWTVDIYTGRSLLLCDLKTESGRDIDVTNINTNDTGSLISFINKNDNTLWMFDTTL